MTHPFHPLFGLDLKLVGRRNSFGVDRVFYRDGNGYLASLPARWTDVTPDDPLVVVSAGRSPFRVDDLVELTTLVARLRS